MLQILVAEQFLFVYVSPCGRSALEVWAQLGFACVSGSQGANGSIPILVNGSEGMSTEDHEVWSICATSSIEPGSAKAFSLLRINEAGESRPFPIVIVRKNAQEYFGYVNSCPHAGLWLNVGSGAFFDEDRKFLRCGRHGSKFEIETGLCIDGPCKTASLEPVAIAAIQGEVCLCGIQLVEDDGIPDPFAEVADETMEIMIHPD
jgi:nitrite reductase/ring-hydroxylating ferredoxin subunit